MDLDWLGRWRRELDGMNEGKRGHPYGYPDGLMDFLALARPAFGLPWRQLEGLVRGLFGALARLYPDLEAPDYTTLWRRVAPKIPEVPLEAGEDAVLALDATGIRVTNRGEWLRRKGLIGRVRSWLKVHVAVDVRTKAVVAVEVTEETFPEARVVPRLVEASQEALAGGRIVQVLGDGAYDTKAVFDRLDEEGIEAVVKVRRDASPRAHGCPARARAVREFQRLGYDAWREAKGYGHRWACEQVFSAFKRAFGEHVVARRRDLMVAEVLTKVALYNRMLRA